MVLWIREQIRISLEMTVKVYRLLGFLLRRQHPDAQVLARQGQENLRLLDSLVEQQQQVCFSESIDGAGCDRRASHVQGQPSKRHLIR